jgi:hypothetical protein
MMDATATATAKTNKEIRRSMQKQLFTLNSRITARREAGDEDADGLATGELATLLKERCSLMNAMPSPLDDMTDDLEIYWAFGGQFDKLDSPEALSAFEGRVHGWNDATLSKAMTMVNTGKFAPQYVADVIESKFNARLTDEHGLAAYESYIGGLSDSDLTFRAARLNAGTDAAELLIVVRELCHRLDRRND